MTIRESVAGSILLVLQLELIFLKIHWCYVAILLFDFLDNFKLRGGVEYVACPPEQVHQVVGDVSSSQVYSLDCAVDRETLIDRGAVADSVSTVQYQASSSSLGVQTQHCLRLEEQRGGSERLEEYLRRSHPIPSMSLLTYYSMG